MKHLVHCSWKSASAKCLGKLTLVTISQPLALTMMQQFYSQCCTQKICIHTHSSFVYDSHLNECRTWKNTLQGAGNQNGDSFGKEGNDREGPEGSIRGASNFLYVVLSDGYARTFP